MSADSFYWDALPIIEPIPLDSGEAVALFISHALEYGGTNCTTLQVPIVRKMFQQFCLLNQWSPNLQNINFGA